MHNFTKFAAFYIISGRKNPLRRTSVLESPGQFLFVFLGLLQPFSPSQILITWVFLQRYILFLLEQAHTVSQFAMPMFWS